jgi:hypothetical protein
MPKNKSKKKADDTLEVLNYLMEEGYKPPRRRKNQRREEEMPQDMIAATDIRNPADPDDDQLVPGPLPFIG